MKLTKERKLLAAVLGLGLGVLGVDRLFLASPASGPTEAEAAAALASPSLPAAAAASLLHDAAGGSPDTIAHRLRQHAQTLGLQPDTSRDAFRASPVWLGGRAERAVGAPVGTPVSGLAAFAQAHRLHAVMGAGASGGGIAIVDGQAYRVGQMIDGMRLVEVRQRSVVLEGASGAVELSLSDVER